MRSIGYLFRLAKLRKLTDLNEPAPTDPGGEAEAAGEHQDDGVGFGYCGGAARETLIADIIDSDVVKARTRVRPVSRH